MVVGLRIPLIKNSPTAIASLISFFNFPRLPITIFFVNKDVSIDVRDKSFSLDFLNDVSCFLGGGDKDLRVNHPFLFFIADRKTGTVMFTGVVYNPVKGRLTAPPERKE